MTFDTVKIETYIPETHLDRLREALNATGALTIGNYDNCMAVSTVIGYWRPLAGANPHIGEEGKISREEEAKVEFVCRADVVEQAVAAIKSVHPYEVPVIHVLPVWKPGL